jgi:hypothetical protein
MQQGFLVLLLRHKRESTEHNSPADAVSSSGHS